MKPQCPKSVCYFLSHYISHRRAGHDYLDCLQRLGLRLVLEPDTADVVIIHNEPWSFPGYFRIYPVLRDRHVIAYSVWETDCLPEHYRFTLGLVDEIWTCSSYCREVLAQAGRPVSIVPHVVKTPKSNAEAEDKLRRRIGNRQGEFLFYTIANVLNPRKGVEDIVRAFAGMFPVEEARLIIKGNVPLPEILRATPGVIQLAGRFDDSEIDALHRISDCFVSAHRSEGWGLAISAAMASGRLVIATAHSGNMEYMNADNSLPVACQVTPIRVDDVRQQPDRLSTDMHWAYVDLLDLQRQMRRAFAERHSLQPLADQARLDMKSYAPDRIAEILSRRLMGSAEGESGS